MAAPGEARGPSAATRVRSVRADLLLRPLALTAGVCALLIVLAYGADPSAPELDDGRPVAVATDGRLHQAEPFGAAAALRSRLLAGAFLFGFLGVVFSFAFASRLAGPIERLAEMARALDAGDPPGPVPIEGPAEVRAVAETLAAMAASIREGRTGLVGARKGAVLDSALEAERRSAFLAEASAVLAGSLDYETTLRSVARLAVPIVADLCFMDLLDRDGTIRRVAAEYVHPEHIDLVREVLEKYAPALAGGHPVARVLRTGRPAVAAEIPDEELPHLFEQPRHLQIARRLGYKSYMVVPLVAGGRTFGTLSFVSTDSGRRYGPADLVLAEELGRRTAMAVDNARLYQEAKEASRAKDAFLTTVSHELRTPLNAMLGWTQLLRQGNLDGPMRERALDTLDRNVRVQAQLIEDLLDVSRIASGKLRLRLQPVDLAGVVSAVVDAVRPAADSRSVAITVSLDPALGPVTGDPDRLQQIVWNLVSNAIKFTPAGGRAEVALEAAGGHAQVTVRDTGAGIPAEFLPHVFEIFRQADATTTRAHGGLGLGLALVSHLTELHGGTVHASSAGAGRGSTFVVRLPLGAAAGEPEERRRSDA